MIELQSEHKPFFYVGTAMLSVEVLYLISLASGPQPGWAVYVCLLALAVSVPMLVGACVGLMVGYSTPAKTLLVGGLTFGALWFVFALAALSKLACLILVVVSIVSYKMLQYHHKDLKQAARSAQQSAHNNGPASGGSGA